MTGSEPSFRAGSGEGSEQARSQDQKPERKGSESFRIAAAPTIRLTEETLLPMFPGEERLFGLGSRGSSPSEIRPKPRMRVYQLLEALRGERRGNRRPDPLLELYAETAESANFLTGFALLSAALSVFSSVGLILSLLALTAGVAQLRLEPSRRRSRSAWTAITLASLGIGTRLVLLAWRFWNHGTSGG
ncbi:MAG: hypothetical protein KatS3mg115_1126 [Candidatus Poribacteria bacterium]|nr:MAG: hypothetical protein KatS3mg115_1126 [Candidatus Poribacteria bacterium]